MARIDPMTGKLDPNVIGLRPEKKKPTNIEKLEALGERYEAILYGKTKWGWWIDRVTHPPRPKIMGDTLEAAINAAYEEMRGE